MLKFICFLTIVWHCLSNVKSIEINMTAYFEMPRLYDFDDYDRCLQDDRISSSLSSSVLSLSTYCLVRAQVLPQNNSRIWQTIEEVSKYDKHHFDHRQLYYGLCVRWCESLLEHLNGTEKQSLYGGNLINNKKINVYVKLFSMEDNNRRRYNSLLNQCINLRLRERYNLKSKSIIEYCDTKNQVTENDLWDQIFYITISALILLVILSSFYDLLLKNQRKKTLLTDRDHYQTPVTGIGNTIGVTFSLSRNWYRLNQNHSKQIGRDFRFLDCYKFCSMLVVIFAHVVWIMYEGGITNPQDPERLSKTKIGTFITSGSLVTLTFFVISGFLLCMNWLAVNEVNNKSSWFECAIRFAKFNIFRYIRLTAIYAFVVLLNGLHLNNPGGPLWRHIVERQQLACRKNWWTNLFYINTFVNTDERCLLQSWYLTSDTHAFIISLIVLIFVTKWPKIRYHVFGIIIVICLIVPGAFVYIENERPIYIAAPQSQRDSFIDDHSFTQFYTPFYMNFGPYFFGIITAFIYKERISKGCKIGYRKDFQLFCYSLIPLSLLWLLSGHVMIQNYENQPSIVWRALYASIHRNIWGFGVAVLIIGMSVKIGSVFREFACLPIFRILGRLSYGAFIIHTFVASVVLATLRQPIYFGMGMLVAFTFFTFTASYLVSLMLAFLIELPISSILKLMK